MNNRIREVREKMGLTQSEMAEKIGLKQSALSSIENGGTITEQNIISICCRFHVDEHWLRTGEGDPFHETDRKWEEFLTIFEQLSPMYQDFLIVMARRLLTMQQESAKSEAPSDDSASK